MKKLLYVACLVSVLALAGCGKKENETVMGIDSYKVGTGAYTATKAYGYTADKNGNSNVTTSIAAVVFDKDGKIVKLTVDEISSDFYFDGTGNPVNYTGGEIKTKKELGDSYGMRGASGIGKEWYEQAQYLEKALVGKNIKDIIGKGDVTAKTGINSAANSDFLPGVNSDEIGMTTSSDGYYSNSTASSSVSGENGDYSMSGSGNWAGVDMTAGVTINTDGIRKAIENAYNNAE